MINTKRVETPPCFYPLPFRHRNALTHKVATTRVAVSTCIVGVAATIVGIVVVVGSIAVCSAAVGAG